LRSAVFFAIQVKYGKVFADKTTKTVLLQNLTTHCLTA